MKNEINNIYKYIEHKILNKENGENIKIIENKINEIDKDFKHNIDKSKREIKEILTFYYRSMLVANPRRFKPKKYGGPSARARKQKLNR